MDGEAVQVLGTEDRQCVQAGLRKSGLLEVGEMLRRDGAVAGGGKRPGGNAGSDGGNCDGDGCCNAGLCLQIKTIRFSFKSPIKNFIEDMQSDLKHRKVLSYIAR